MLCYFLLDSKLIGKRYLKSPFGIRELPYMLRVGKEKKPAEQHLYKLIWQTN